MRRTVLTVLTGILALAICSVQSQDDVKTQQSRNYLAAIGQVLRADTKKRIGTAFVAGKNRNIFMAAHLAESDTLLFKPFTSARSYTIAVKYVLPAYDVAIYKLTGGEQPVSLMLGDIHRMRPGDTITCFGWVSDTVLCKAPSTIKSIGQAYERGRVVDFIDFFCEAVPGFSGGPVVNKDEQVVAIVSTAWDWSNLPGRSSEQPPKKRKVRAVFLHLLQMLDEDVRTSVTADTTQSEGLRLLDATED